jgi:hypothetical protein
MAGRTNGPGARPGPLLAGHADASVGVRRRAFDRRRPPSGAERGRTRLPRSQLGERVRQKAESSGSASRQEGL